MLDIQTNHWIELTFIEVSYSIFIDVDAGYSDQSLDRDHIYRGQLVIDRDAGYSDQPLDRAHIYRGQLFNIHRCRRWIFRLITG